MPKSKSSAALEGATDEEKKALHQAFREENKDLAEQMKALQKEIRETVGNKGNRPTFRRDNDRRPDKEVRKGERRPQSANLEQTQKVISKIPDQRGSNARRFFVQMVNIPQPE